MFLDNQATFHPAVEAASPGIQDLVLTDSPGYPAYSSIDDVYERFHADGKCSVGISQMDMLGIDFLCDDRGLYTVASCLGFARVPVDHRKYCITALLEVDKAEDNYNVRGISIIGMRKDAMRK